MKETRTRQGGGSAFNVKKPSPWGGEVETDIKKKVEVRVNQAENSIYKGSEGERDLGMIKELRRTPMSWSPDHELEGK